MASDLQDAVRALLAIPDLKLCNSLEEHEVARCVALFDEISLPVSKADAVALVELLDRSDDDMFEANWTLLHIIEKSLDWPDWDVLERCSGEWSNRLVQRLLNGGYNAPVGFRG